MDKIPVTTYTPPQSLDSFVACNIKKRERPRNITLFYRVWP
jgi:hypothetical protein